MPCALGLSEEKRDTERERERETHTERERHRKRGMYGKNKKEKQYTRRGGFEICHNPAPETRLEESR